MAARRRRWAARPRHPLRLLRWLLVGGTLTIIGLTIALIVALSTGAGLAAGAAVASAYISDLPSIDSIAGVGAELFQTTTIRARDGRLLGDLLGQGRRRVVPPEQIPQVVKLATIVAEDATFYENPGVEFRAVVRAFWQNLRGGHVVSGASTITQQLVKNVLLTPEVTVERKLKEAVLAYQVSQRFSKDEILGLYLNQIYYGSLAYGVAAAAETYFGKDLADVTLAEAALLAGIPRSPSTSNPFVDPAAAREGQLRVLDQIERQGFAAPERVAEARREPVRLASPSTRIQAPHFFNYVLAQLQERYGPEISRNGWRITTSLDLDLQTKAEQLVRDHVRKLAANDATNGALTALRPATGEVLAMVGSADFADPSIDGQVNVTLAERQPGSAFKLFTYAAALQKGYTAATMLLDIPTTIPIAGQPPYAPSNYDGKFRGPVSLRTALGSSLNVPAVRTQLIAGLDETVELAKRLGVTSLNDPSRIGPALALGSNEVRLIDLTAAYGVFANGGRRVQPHAILCIRDARGRIVEQYGDGCSLDSAASPLTELRTPVTEQLVSPELAFLLTSILSDDAARAEAFGRHTVLELPGRPAAVKTGTTQDTRDALVVGYTPQLVAGVWIGNSDGRPMKEATGIVSAAPIWHDFMVAALAGQPAYAFEPPPGVVQVEVDALSGFIPSAYAGASRLEYFLPGTAPTQRDMVHQPFRIDRATGLLATKDTPVDQVEERVFAILPKEAEAWQRQQPAKSPLALPPQEFATARAPQRQAGSVEILAPAEGQPVRSVLEITGRAAGEGFLGYAVHYGSGAQPGGWIRIGRAADTPVADGQIEAIDTSQLADGVYTLRLTVRRAGGREDIVFRRFHVDNTPPALGLSSITDGAQVLPGPTLLATDVHDDVGVAAVEFVVDGRSVGRARSAPYTVAWTAVRGAHLLEIVATDRAGNVARAVPLRFRVP